MVAFLGNTGVTRRLLRIGGRWVLEHQVFMPLGQGVFRPTTQRVQGESAILLAVQEAEALRQMTARVMQDYGAPEVGEVAFESVNGGAWRPCAAPDPEEKPVVAATASHGSAAEHRTTSSAPAPSSVEVDALKHQLSDLATKVDKAATHAELTSLRDSITEIVSARPESPSMEAPFLAELEELREKLNGSLEKFKDVATQPEVAELKDILCEVAERQERFARQIRDLQSRVEAVAGPPPGAAEEAELSPEESDAMNAIASALGSGETMLGPDG